MILMPIVYVTDMDRSVEFYESLGFEVDPHSRAPVWTELRAGERAVLALHAVPTAAEARGLELALVAEEPLEAVEQRFGDVVVRGTADETFGRSLVISDPDGRRIQVNEHDPSLAIGGR